MLDVVLNTPLRKFTYYDYYYKFNLIADMENTKFYPPKGTST